MSSWRDRLCGTIALRSVNQMATPSISQIMDPSNNLSSGGQNQLPETPKSNTLGKFKKNFVLPTDYYSVLVFNKEGNAVIYSDNQPEATEEHEFIESAASLEALKVIH